MGRSKESIVSRINKAIKDHPQLKRDKNQIFCTCCCQPVNFNSTIIVARVKNHVNTDLHISNLGKEQPLINETMKKVQENQDMEDNFNDRLALAFIRADIPLQKLLNPSLREFLKNETKKKIPHP